MLSILLSKSLIFISFNSSLNNQIQLILAYISILFLNMKVFEFHFYQWIKGFSNLDVDLKQFI